nr:hypothetical protein [Butyricicoccus sp. AF10-3]
MNRDLLKRVGMLTAATAACTAGVFGALAVNGLRYMRPTTDNWWLLPWVEPAERIEQCVMDFGEGDPTYTVTGYDAQNREIWSRTTFGKLASVGSSVMCTSAIHRRGISSVRAEKRTRFASMMNRDGLSVWKPTMAAYRRITTAAMRLKRIWRKRTTRRAR